VKRRALSWVLLCLACHGLWGCTGTTLRTGAPPGKVAPGYDRRWHPAFLLGAIGARDNYPIERICPNGWSEIYVGPDEFTILASLLTLFVYSPSRVTIVCAAEPLTGPPPLAPLPSGDP
jgi:hypothetical protein